MQKLTEEELWVLSRRFITEKLESGVKPDESFTKGIPHPKQRLFLEAEHDPTFRDQKIIEVLFGGSVGGGKSFSLLTAALKYVHVPKYSALLLRRNYPDLKQEGGLIALAHEFLNDTSAKWNEVDKTWTFPSGAVLRFGYLDTENAKFRYQGSEIQFCGFDELTQFSESQYKYLFSRLRKREGIAVPLRMMSSSNPGGVGGKWVFDRFISEDFEPTRAREKDVWYKYHENAVGDAHITAFIPSMLEDNPSLDREAYLESLMQLDELTRQQYLNGDWQIQIRGNILHTYSEPHTVISWSQFEKVFEYRGIPSHWKVGVYQDWGSSEGHPCITSWFATAGENSPVVGGVPTAGMVFLYRGTMSTQSTARDMAKVIRKAMGAETSQCINWQMSHEAASERLEYNKQGLPFVPWRTGRTRGIEQLKNALSLVDVDRPNPFKPSLSGHPQLFLVVDDDELIHAKTDSGLARWRAEILAYTWSELKSGEPSTRLVPRKMFDDAVDTMRACAADYFPASAQKTLREKVHDRVEKIQPTEFVESIQDQSYKAHVLAQRAILADEAVRKLKEVERVVSDWADIG